MDQRATDAGRITAAWGRWGRDLTTLLAVALAATSVFITVGQIGRVQSESDDRRDQTCLLFETAQKRAVDQLRQTYSYLLSLTSEQRREPLNRTIIATLPQTERAARTAKAPPYCNEPHVGLPEPDPVVPKRPPGL